MVRVGIQLVVLFACLKQMDSLESEVPVAYTLRKSLIENHEAWGGDNSSVLEHSPSWHEALSSIPGIGDKTDKG